MSEPWTPGPWREGGAEEVYGTEVFEDNTRELTIAAVADHGLGFEGQAEANARLIAAAPEMAEFIEEVAASGHEIHWTSDLTREARALMARIRGEA